METIELKFSDIDFDESEIFKALYGSTTPNAEIVDIFNHLLSKASEICRPRFCSKKLNGSVVNSTQIAIDGKLFTTGRVISTALHGSEAFYLIVATAGREFNSWLHSPEINNDIIYAYIADAIGSEIAEATVRKAYNTVSSVADQKLTNSYSPGYCGWHVREQKAFFDFFPDSPCGVTLCDSCLMDPIKSVTTVVGTGELVEKKPYGCNICFMKNCFKKRL
ncbi:MAG: hypothetical protein RR388_02635 [Rikenellaceae bacterium]